MNREMGKLLLKVDPWLPLDTKYPQNVYLKIMRLNNRKRKIDHTEMVSYGAAKRPKETSRPQQVPESPSTSTALLDPESAPVILAPEEKVSIYHLWYMYVHGVDIYTFSYFRSAQRLHVPHTSLAMLSEEKSVQKCATVR